MSRSATTKPPRCALMSPVAPSVRPRNGHGASCAASCASRSSGRCPSSRWRANDTDLVITEGRWWSRGPGACPVQLQPGCSLNQPRLRALTRREPFAEDSPAPLDVVLPARSFSVPTGTTRLRTGTVAGRSAIGLRTTVAEVTPILSGLRSVGNWRELYPGDDVELWLDDDHLVPLELIVRSTNDASRRRWAAERGYRDPPGTVLMKV